jgi:FtsP/CotA-like multicopper oxidase with cupredoxin domain
MKRFLYLVASGLLAISLLTGAALADTRSFDWVLEGGALKGSENVLRVQAGDRVEIGIRSDTAMALHLHGYDIEVAMSPGGVAVMAFDAHATGRFPVVGHDDHGHDHGHGALFYVEVHPN